MKLHEITDELKASESEISDLVYKFSEAHYKYIISAGSYCDSDSICFINISVDQENFDSLQNIVDDLIHKFRDVGLEHISTEYDGRDWLAIAEVKFKRNPVPTIHEGKKSNKNKFKYLGPKKDEKEANIYKIGHDYSKEPKGKQEMTVRGGPHADKRTKRKKTRKAQEKSWKDDVQECGTAKPMKENRIPKGEDVFGRD